MSQDIILYGLPISTYVRTARMTCVEKGINHTLESADFGSEDYRSNHHPYSKFPAMRHGDFDLFETTAIIRYIDETFDGPALQPTSAADRAVMEQWMGVLDSYVYPRCIAAYVLQYIIPRGPDGKPDRAAIDAALPNVKHDLGLLERAYQGREWVAGDAISLADLLIAPVVQTIGMVPEGAEMLGQHANLQGLLSRIGERPSAAFLAPPQ
ncbi:glutathione S-transferase family protein [Haliangium sp.]|uniref:glutathione S-transferase family protein n=1 Tax=Haliangium sp. TaxID=2663208 RepID=UPI003D144D3C